MVLVISFPSVMLLLKPEKECHPLCLAELSLAHSAAHVASPLRILGSLSSFRPVLKAVSILALTRSAMYSKGSVA